ncbi:glutathione S-transferase family protein [Bdellovibrio sp. 22V]|uniref:glutathione S-transferase family protein n=1 Tax=Bdellovibrio TaxID=958 RepID=UPI002543AC0C|nr:glutathione S-transferase family protein [Bdellovibrio sp. 22V]WII71200.1 glutathione S-transferase family protein [Bdellovibrio sp. 22V]
MTYHVHSDKPVFELIIGDKTYSSWSMRAWLVAVQSGLPFKEILIKLDTPKTGQNIAKYTNSGKVPALKHGKTIVWDSLAIAEYLNELSPEAQLWPADPALRALARSYSAEVHSGFMSLRSQLSMDLQLKSEARHLLSGTVKDIERILFMWEGALQKSEGPYLFGEFTIADAFFAPIVFRFLSYGVKIKNKTALSYMENIQEHHGVQFWLEEALAEKNTTPIFK